MMAERTWILFYYNSLPDMPKSCSLFSNEVMHRDFFECNPTNTNHHKYPIFENLSYDCGCHMREVKRFLAKNDPKYVVFYTRHTTQDRESRNKVVGYFKVGKIFKKPRKGFKASESVLLPKNKCIEINYKSRGVPVSWSNSPRIKDEISKILNDLIRKPDADIKRKYQDETNKIMNLLKTKAGKRKILDICTKCMDSSQCFWGKTRNKEEVLLDLYKNYKKCSDGQACYNTS